MHPAALSIKVFAAYVVLTGVGLLLVPATVLSLLGMAVPQEIWVRVLGAVAVVLGYYYGACGASGDEIFFRASVRGRVIFALLCVLLVAAFRAPLQLLVFGVVDLLGAAWTALALASAKNRHPA